jgi:hypothetical protein
MTKDKYNHDEAIRRIVSHARLDKPSEGFTARIMDRLLVQPEPVKKWMITYQYGILAIAAGIAIMMLIFRHGLSSTLILKWQEHRPRKWQETCFRADYYG